MTKTPDLIEDDFDFDDWLATGTVTRRSVELHNRGDLVAQHDELERRLTVAEANEKGGGGGERSLGVPAGESVAAVLAEMETLYEQWQAAGILVTVRGLEESEVRAIHEECPDPAVPALLAGEVPEPGTPEHDERIATQKVWLEERDRVVEERNLRSIALAVVEVRQGGRVRRSMSVAQARALRQGPHGKASTAKLIQAVASATTGDVDVPRPTSRPASGNGRG